jgi:hypothetical protein
VRASHPSSPQHFHCRITDKTRIAEHDKATFSRLPSPCFEAWRPSRFELIACDPLRILVRHQKEIRPMRLTHVLSASAVSLSIAALTACGGSGNAPTDFGAGGSSSSAGGTGGKSGGSAATGGSKTVGGGGTGIVGSMGGSSPGMGAGGAGNGVCFNAPNIDGDMDGWTGAQGDCNDCDPNVNPGAIDVLKKDDKGNPLPPEMQIDADCDGAIPTPTSSSCDASLPVGTVGNGMDAAKAMGLCNVNVEEAPADPKNRKWGVIQATFNGIDAKALSGSSKPLNKIDFGILPNFGAPTKPQEGKMLLALSNGEARAPGQPDFGGDQCHFDKGITSGFPGLGTWPKEGTCGTTDTPHDGVALDLKLRVPTNAKSMSFNFRFFSCEYPMYTCSIFNDVFAVLFAPLGSAASPLDPKDPMYPDVAFEATMNGKKNVIGVNNESFFQACKPGAAVMGMYPNCKGEADLAGSGFEGHGASAWLASSLPVTPGGVYLLRIAIWDSADGILDSTAVIDNFQFAADPGTGVGTVVVPTPNLVSLVGLCTDVVEAGLATACTFERGLCPLEPRGKPERFSPPTRVTRDGRRRPMLVAAYEAKSPAFREEAGLSCFPDRPA